MTLLLRWVLRVCVVLAASVVLYVSVTAVQVWLTSRQTSENHANAIVVFGTAEYNGVPSADLEARLNETLALYQLGRAPLIAVTGGKQPGDLYSEAGVSAAYLHIHGVPLSKIVVGGGSDTYQNVQSIVMGEIRIRRAMGITWVRFHPTAGTNDSWHALLVNRRSADLNLSLAFAINAWQNAPEENR